MLNSVQIKNFGPLNQLDWQSLGSINLVIGNNGSGKSFLLKAMYSAVRTLEDYKRGDNPDSAAEILFKKLYWTFQPEKIGDLVTKPSDTALSFSLMLDQQNFSYSFGKDTTKAISALENRVLPRTSNSVFLPAKEVLSLHHIILESREQGKQFGFDDTYLDLARALQIPQKKRMFAVDVSQYHSDYISPLPTRGCDSKDFRQSRKLLKDMIDGEIEYDKTENRWNFKRGNQRFSIGVTAEGVKKVAILDTLLGNGYLSENSIIFIDEPESALHPEAISKLLDIIAILAKHGIQFFLVSHSYFVIKKLFLVAQEQKFSIPVLSKEGDSWQQSDLLDEMPDNPIINESIRLYEEEVDFAFK
ncbi:MAG: AAA family ATPase [Methylobacter sp.]|nr:AAA family ATPase [Methylobacter sp.]